MNDFVGKLEELIEIDGERFPDRRERDRPFEGEDQRGHRTVPRPRHGLKWLAGTIASAAGLVTGLVALEPYLPIETKAHAQEAMAAVDQRFDKVEGRVTAVESRLGAIDRNGLKTLNLQLRATLRSIDADLRGLPENNPARANLEASRDQAQLDLEETNRQLNALAQQKDGGK